MFFAVGIFVSGLVQSIVLEQDSYPLKQLTEQNFQCKEISYRITYTSNFGNGSALSLLEKAGKSVQRKDFDKLSLALRSVYLPQITIKCPENGTIKILVSGSSTEKKYFGVERNIIVMID